MSDNLLPILQNVAVLQRTSTATRRALEERASPASSKRFLSQELFTLLQQITATILPQQSVGTAADIAATIDARLLAGKNAGWRFADLPPDGEAYRQGLTIFTEMLKQTPLKSYDGMPSSAREAYLCCIANGDVDAHARFPLSRWLGMLRTDAVKVWLAHPSTMQKMGYYGFADGESGTTDGPNDQEGWTGITQNMALPFEQGTGTTTKESKR